MNGGHKETEILAHSRCYLSKAGSVRFGTTCYGVDRLVGAWQERLGMVRFGMVWCGMAGSVRPVAVSYGMVGIGLAGWAGTGELCCVQVRCGRILNKRR